MHVSARAEVLAVELLICDYENCENCEKGWWKWRLSFLV